MENVHIHSFLSQRIDSLENLSELFTNKGKKRERNDVGKKSVCSEELDSLLSLSTPYRRTGSFIPYRIPRRVKILRHKLAKKRQEDENDKQEQNSNTNKRRKVEKKPRCRKHQRRPHLLLAQRSHHQCHVGSVKAPWLSTHIWHSKRFLMSSEFGMCIATHHRAHGITRKLSDALADRAVVHDESYVKPVELSGSAYDVTKLLCSLTDPAASFYARSGHDMNEIDSHSDSDTDDDDDEEAKAAAIERTSRKVKANYAAEQSIMLHHCNAFPEKCIGPALLTFLPSNDGNEDITRAWLWLHPSILPLVCEEIKEYLKQDLSTKVNFLDVIPEAPARFNIRGTQALSVLAKILYPIEATESDNNCCHLFRSIVGLSDKAIRKVWKLCDSLAFHVKDVAAMASSTISQDKKDKNKQKIKKPLRVDWNESHITAAAMSEMWSTDKRMKQKVCALSIVELNEQRAQQRHALHSISDVDYSQNMIATSATPSVPIVIVRKDESVISGQYTVPALFRAKKALRGYDLILPQCYAMKFWTALQILSQEVSVVGAANATQRGNLDDIKLSSCRKPAVLSIGYREMEYLHLQAGLPSFPRDYPETTAGKEYWQRRTHARALIEAKKPGNKRKHILSWPIPHWGLLHSISSSSSTSSLNNFHSCCVFSIHLFHMFNFLIFTFFTFQTGSMFHTEPRLFINIRVKIILIIR